MQFLGKTWELGLWSGEKIQNDIAIDTETTLITDYNIPNLITFQATNFDSGRVFFVKKEDLPRFFNIHQGNRLVFHNAAFDLEVICKAFEDMRMKFPVFDWIESGKVYDTSILYRLFMLAAVGNVPFKYNLALLAKDFLNTELDKDESIRLTFAQYWNNGNVNYDEISQAHLEYASKDAITTLAIFRNLMTRLSQYKSESDMTHAIQLAGDFTLNRMHLRGIGFDIEERNKLYGDLIQQSRVHAEILATYGWVQGQAGIQERYTWIIKDFLKLNLPLTESGDISSASEDLEPYSNIPFVSSYLEFQRLRKLIEYIEPLTTDRVHPRYDLLKNTGRTSARGPNIQNPPRVGGIRELFKPKEDHVFLVVDYSFIELCTLAQTTYSKYGFSRLRDIINSGKDPHKAFASEFLGKPESEITKSERQFAKAANFGYPGGLGPDKFIMYAKTTYGVDVTRSEAIKVRESWFTTYPENKMYMDDTSSASWTITGRLRGDADYCSSKNTPFQGLAADGAKLALFYLEKAGFKPVAFVHDEIICEEPKRGHMNRFEEMKRIMTESMQLVVPDVKIGVEGHVMNKWEKK